jgi:hypothetical protein
VNAVYTIDEAKLAVKYMSKGKRKTDESFMARLLPLQQVHYNAEGLRRGKIGICR